MLKQKCTRDVAEIISDYNQDWASWSSEHSLRVPSFLFVFFADLSPSFSQQGYVPLHCVHYKELRRHRVLRKMAFFRSNVAMFSYILTQMWSINEKIEVYGALEKARREKKIAHLKILNTLSKRPSFRIRKVFTTRISPRSLFRAAPPAPASELHA